MKNPKTLESSLAVQHLHERVDFLGHGRLDTELPGSLAHVVADDQPHGSWWDVADEPDGLGDFANSRTEQDAFALDRWAVIIPPVRGTGDVYFEE